MARILLTLAALTWLVAGLLVLGARKPGYRHRRDTISELGERGAPRERLVAAGVFLPVGLAMLLVAWLTAPSGSAAALLALCIGVGYLAAAAFPCDPGSPLSGSWRQALHNLGGAVEYLGGAFALVQIAGHAGPPFEALGVLVLAAAFAISVRALAGIRGLIQRTAELCLFGGLVLALLRLH